MLGNFIKKINKPITHVIFIVVIYAVLYFLKEKIYISSTVDKSIGVFTTIFSTLITAFTIILAISDRDIIKEIILNKQYWEQLCSVSFLPIVYSLIGMTSYLINVIVGCFIVFEIFTVTILIITILATFLFLYILINVVFKLNYNKKSNRIE
jgi:hypothetical protein